MVDSATIVALVVSLVALFVSFLQLTGQIFGTAEGYRRCRRPFIGPWCALTRSHWLWSEFRYEIFYTTPEILLVQDSESNGSAKGNHVWRLNEPHFSGSDGRARRVPTRKDPPFLTVHSQEAERLHNIPWRERIPRMCRNLFTATYRTGRACLPFHDGEVEDWEDRGETAELVVSWIQLLRKLHDLYCEYGQPGPDGTKTCECYVQADRKQDWQARRKIHSDHETAVAVRYRKYSWDLVPPGVNRPLATSRVKDVVILALRLGMEWRELQPQVSQMYAAGNGYNIRSLDIRGVGCVLVFETFNVHSSDGLSPDPEDTGHPRYIPSSIVDAMACGVLSACPRLIRRRKEKDDSGNEKPTTKPDKNADPIRFLMIDKERTVRVRMLLNFLDVPGNIWADGSDLNLPALAPERRIEGWLRTWRRTPFNDLVFMITPFLPVDGVPSIRVLFNGFCGMQSVSVFSYFEARMALLMRIEKRGRQLLDSKSRSQLDADKRELMDVHDQWQSLEKEWAGDFYMKTFGKPGEPTAVGYGRAGEGLDQKRRLDLIEFCKIKHESTTIYFEDQARIYDLGFKKLLNAHFTMAAKASISMRDDWNKGHQLKDDAEFRRRYPGETPYAVRSHRAPWDMGVRELFTIAWRYVDHVERGDFYNYLKEVFRCEFSTVKAEAIWWNMMLRGVVQSMAVKFEDGKVVPSYVYSDNTTVYFT